MKQPKRIVGYAKFRSYIRSLKDGSTLHDVAVIAGMSDSQLRSILVEGVPIGAKTAHRFGYRIIWPEPIFIKEEQP